jgi:hypothetical protein
MEKCKIREKNSYKSAIERFLSKANVKKGTHVTREIARACRFQKKIYKIKIALLAQLLLSIKGHNRKKILLIEV